MKTRSIIRVPSATNLLCIAMMLHATRKPVLGIPSMTAQSALNSVLQPRVFDVTSCATRKLPSLEIASQRQYLIHHRLEQHLLWQNLVRLSSDVADVLRCLTIAETYTPMALQPTWRSFAA